MFRFVSDIDNFHYLLQVPDQANLLGKTTNENLDVLSRPKKHHHENINFKKELIKRIQQILSINRKQAESKLDLLLKKFEKTPVTINFPIQLFQNDDFLTSTHHKSCWNLPNKSNQDEYLQIRAETEEYFWGYNLFKANKIIDNYNKNDLAQKREKFIRPLYGALNITDHEGGGAPGYGLAYFILKPTVKYRSTFQPEDSYNLYQVIKAYNKNQNPNPELARIESCRFDELIKLLYYTDTVKLNRLLNNQMIYSDYIEVEIHGQVNYKEDIDELIILHDSSDSKNKAFGSLSVREQEQVRTGAIDFAQRHHIKAKIVNSKGEAIEILHRPADEQQATIIVPPVESVIPDSRAWKKMSSHFLRRRTGKLKAIDKLIADYEYLKHHGNLTTRLLTLKRLIERVTLWLSNHGIEKNKNYKTVTRLLNAIYREQKKISKVLSTTHNFSNMKPKQVVNPETEGYSAASVRYSKYLKKKFRAQIASYDLNTLINLYEMMITNVFGYAPSLPDDMSKTDLRAYLLSHLTAQFINRGLDFPQSKEIIKIIGQETALDIKKHAIINESRYVLNTGGKQGFKDYLSKNKTILLTKPDNGFKVFLKGLGVLGASIFGFGVGGYLLHRRFFGSRASLGHEYLGEVKRIESQHRKGFFK